VDDALNVLAPNPAAGVDPERRRAWARLAAEHHRIDLLTAWIRGAALSQHAHVISAR